MIRSLLAALALAAAPALAAEPTPTEVVVRVISQDAKWVGDLTGGAAIRLVDVATGALLAEGKVTGSTGDTPAIMAAQGRAPIRSTPGSAAFTTALAITAPTLVRVEVTGPLGYPATMQRATSERWLIPGTSMAGTDGWVVELPGLAITPDGAPPVWRRGQAQPLTVWVQLMCGCPITPGGMWAAEDYAVTATIKYPGAPALTLPLPFKTAPGRFGADWTPAFSGKAKVTVTAFNRKTGNAGVLRKMVEVK
jgi:hypothetical protein